MHSNKSLYHFLPSFGASYTKTLVSVTPTPSLVLRASRHLIDLATCSLTISVSCDYDQGTSTLELAQPSADFAQERLCKTCQSIFYSEVIRHLVERPKDIYHIRKHLLCSELAASARTCHLCRWILAECTHGETVTELSWPRLYLGSAPRSIYSRLA